MNDLRVYNYGLDKISFLNEDGSVMVNATEMAKPFGNRKRPQFWLSLKGTKDFLSAISVARNLAAGDLVVVRQGGAVQGTWFHRDVAIDFARWLSPMFAIWCNDRIIELLTKGYVDLRPFSSVRKRVKELYGDDLRLMENGTWKKLGERYLGEVDFGYGEAYPFLVECFKSYDIQVLGPDDDWTDEFEFIPLVRKWYVNAPSVPEGRGISRYVSRFLIDMGIPYMMPRGRRKIFAVSLREKKDLVPC